MEKGLSAVIITCNEERTIGRALDSLRGIADQIVILDTGSSDATLEVSRAHPTRPDIHVTTWKDDFSAVRNIAVSYCRYTWCFVLDGDEYVDEACRSSVRACIQKQMEQHPTALYAPLIDNLNGHTLRNNPRIFSRRDTLHYHGRVHEYLTDTNPANLIFLHDIVIKHTGYQPDVYNQKNKYSRNRRLLEQQIREEPEDFRWKYFMLRYLDIPSPEALIILQEFGQLPLPYAADIEVYAFNAKSRLVMCLLEDGDQQIALKHATDLYQFYQDYDSTLLFIFATLRSSRRKFEQTITVCQRLLAHAESLGEDEYLHEKMPPGLIQQMIDEISTLQSGFIDG